MPDVGARALRCAAVSFRPLRESLAKGGIPGARQPRRPVAPVGMGTAPLPLAEPECRRRDRLATHPQAPGSVGLLSGHGALDTGQHYQARVTTTTPARGMSNASIAVRV
jgi:hypothetical protein